MSFANGTACRPLSADDKVVSETQMIAIIHNPTTMEAAPVWYGVTMFHPSASRVLGMQSWRSKPPDALNCRAGNKPPRADARRRMNILTTRLELVPATAKLIRLEISDPQALGQRLNASIPAGWPPEEVKGVLGFFAGQMDAGVTGDGWGVYYWVALAGDDGPRTLVGSGGFMSKPNTNSTVEIGYGTLDKFQRRGYATEAVSGLAQWALSQPDMFQVIAGAMPENPASVRVLLKNGFVDAGPGQEEGTRRFTVSREK